MQAEGSGARPPPGLAPKGAQDTPPQHRPRSSSGNKSSDKKEGGGKRYEPKDDKVVLGPPQQKSFPSSQRQYNQPKTTPPSTYNTNGHNPPQSYNRRGGPSDRRPSSRGHPSGGMSSRNPSRSTGRSGPRGGLQPMREDPRASKSESWSPKMSSILPSTDDYDVEELSTSPTPPLPSNILPELLGDFSAGNPTSNESDFIASLFGGGLPLAADPGKLATATPKLLPNAGKPVETMEEWTARKEQESKALAGWFNFEEADDEPLESSHRSDYRNSSWGSGSEPSDSRFSGGRKPEFLERRREDKQAKSTGGAKARPPPGFAAREEERGGDFFSASFPSRDKRRAPPPGFSAPAPSTPSPADWFKTEADTPDKQRPVRRERDRERDRDWERDRESSDRGDRNRRKGYNRYEDADSEGGQFREKVSGTPTPPPGFSRPITRPPGFEGFSTQQEEKGVSTTEKITDGEHENDKQPADGTEGVAKSGSPSDSASNVQNTPTLSAEPTEEPAVGQIPAKVTDEQPEPPSHDATPTQMPDELQTAAPSSPEPMANGAEKGEEKVAEAESIKPQPGHIETEYAVPQQEHTNNTAAQGDSDNTQSSDTPAVIDQQGSSDKTEPSSPALTKNDNDQDNTPKKSVAEAKLRSKRRSLKSYLPSNNTPSPSKNLPLFPMAGPIPMSPLGPLMPSMPGASSLYPLPPFAVQPDQLSFQQIQQQQQQKQNPQQPMPSHFPPSPYNGFGTGSQKQPAQSHSSHNKSQPQAPQQPHTGGEGLPPFLFPTPTGSPPIPYVMPAAGPLFSPALAPHMYTPNVFPMGPHPANIYNLPLNASFGNNHAHAPPPHHHSNNNHNQHNSHNPGFSDHSPHSHHHHNAHNNNNPHPSGEEDQFMKWFASPARPMNNPSSVPPSKSNMPHHHHAQKGGDL